MRILRTGAMILAAGAVLMTACADSGGGNRLVYGGEELAITEVKCLSALKRVIVEIDGGKLTLSPNDSEPGFRALLRFEDMARGSLSNRAQDGSNTGGIDLDVESGASGEVEMMREAWVMDPERHPDVEPITLEIEVNCPPD